MTTFQNHSRHLLLALAFASTAALAQGADPSAACLTAMAENPELQVLKTRFPISGESIPTLEMLSSEAKPNKTEKVAIQKLDANLTKCFMLGKEWRAANYVPGINMATDEYFTSQRAILADLFAGKISFGTFTKSRDAIDEKLVSQAREITQRNAAAQREAARQAARDRDLEEQRRRELAEQRAAQNRNAAIGMYMQNQNNFATQQQQNYNNQLQMINNAARISSPPTVNTNCLPNGAGGFNCTSR